MNFEKIKNFVIVALLLSVFYLFLKYSKLSSRIITEKQVVYDTITITIYDTIRIRDTIKIYQTQLVKAFKCDSVIVNQINENIFNRSFVVDIFHHQAQKLSQTIASYSLNQTRINLITGLGYQFNNLILYNVGLQWNKFYFQVLFNDKNKIIAGGVLWKF